MWAFWKKSWFLIAIGVVTGMMAGFTVSGFVWSMVHQLGVYKEGLLVLKEYLWLFGLGVGGWFGVKRWTAEKESARWAKIESKLAESFADHLDALSNAVVNMRLALVYLDNDERRDLQLDFLKEEIDPDKIGGWPPRESNFSTLLLDVYFNTTRSDDLDFVFFNIYLYLAVVRHRLSEYLKTKSDGDLTQLASCMDEFMSMFKKLRLLCKYQLQILRKRDIDMFPWKAAPTVKLPSKHVLDEQIDKIIHEMIRA